MVSWTKQRCLRTDRLLQRKGNGLENSRTLTKLSASCHGRDIFSPSAAKIYDDFLADIKAQPRTEIKQFDWPDDLKSIIYVDHSGNAITELRVAKVIAQTVISLKEHKYGRALVFSDVAVGEAF